MAVAALVLWAAFAAIAIGLRPLLHRRRTGSTGRVRPTGDRTAAAHAAEGVHTVAMLCGLAAPVLDLAGVLDPVGALDAEGVHATGLALTVAGVALVAAAQAHMAEAWRIGTDPAQRTALVTTGPFALVRHPVLSGTVLAVAGLALLVPSVPALLSVGLIALAVELGARGVEEPHLRRVHGDSYGAYAARVGRFVPRPSRRLG